MKRAFCLILILLLIKSTFSQIWQWSERPEVLNPSGIEVPDNNTYFQVLDWNHDGRWDLIQNNSGELELYLQETELGQFHIDNSVHFPQIGFYPRSLQYPEPKLTKNFEFIDWDSDGDFDLAADSSFFWWNNGENFKPVWIKDDSLLRRVGIGKDFSFADIDRDNDWDFIFQEQEFMYTFLFRNSGSNTEPVWQLTDTLHNEAYGFFSYKFLDSDNASLVDLTAVGFIPADPGAHYSLEFLQNTGTLDSPIWEADDSGGLRFYWSAFIGGLPVYDFYDFNGDGVFDLIKNDWQRHLAISLNKGNNDTPAFSDTSDSVYGAINGQSNVRPYFYDANDDELDDLMVFEDFWTFFNFLCYYYHESSNRVYTSLNGHFESDRLIFNNIPRPYNPIHPATFLRDLTISFADVDSDNDMDFISGYIKVDCEESVKAIGVLYFENTGSKSEPVWQENSTKFSYFSSPDSMFYDPHLIDIDNDNDYDLFLQKAGEYRFYEKLNTLDENWQRNRTWETGLENHFHYSATFADLNLDGTQDLIFGESDGSLIFYENTGSKTHPQWQKNTATFAGINVDSLSVPAFSDIDQDGLPDLVIGNADGRLFYFENTSIIDAVKETKTIPATFLLSQNYPNPFNPETTIKFSIPVAGLVRLEIYNLLGELVRTLFVGEMNPGEHALVWDGKNERGLVMPSGVYVYKLQAGSFTATRKMILLR